MCLDDPKAYTKARRIKGYKVMKVTPAGNLYAAFAQKRVFKKNGAVVVRGIKYAKGVKHLAEPISAVCSVGQSPSYNAGFHFFKSLEAARKYKFRYFKNRRSFVVVSVEGMVTHKGRQQYEQAFVSKDLTFGETVRD